MRRRGRDDGLAGLFVEREQELATFERTLRAAREGIGGTIIVEAPAGTGKSRLLTVAGDLARREGMQVLGATGSELEQDFPFGIAIQLLGPRFSSIEFEAHAALVDGPAAAAGTLLEGESSDLPPTGNQEYPLIQSLFSLTSNLAATGALLMLVDDLHWSDRPSLRYLVYLAHRLADRPIALIVAVRDGEPAADPQALTALGLEPTAVTLRPSLIAARGVRSLVRREFPDADDVFIGACARVTHGNPLLLTELLAQIRADGRGPDSATAERLTDLAPEAIVSSVVARLGTMSAGARALACAVSILGDGALLPHAAALAGLTSHAAHKAADALAAVHMLRPGAPLSFVHPPICCCLPPRPTRERWRSCVSRRRRRSPAGLRPAPCDCSIGPWPSNPTPRRTAKSLPSSARRRRWTACHRRPSG
jgi:hypothetical protein